jgi:D-aspartate ligase
MRPAAVVMNMFYTGLGIARSLGEKGIPVIGLTAQRGIYGNFTRYAKSVACPDSRNEPEELLAFLLKLGKSMESRSVLFPTRDHDLVFLDRFRKELEPIYSLVVPESGPLSACLDKWQTYLAAEQAGVPTPKCWLIGNRQQLLERAGEVGYPCILKPVAAHYWRREGNWNLVGGRKVVCIESRDQLLAEHAVVARADERVLLQEMIPGGDECLVIAACYLDRKSNLVAGFNARKLAQAPRLVGTGCIVQAADHAELFDPAVRLLKALRYTGVAEVEFKWDAARKVYQLIEINPRPWDQHRLGVACGNDLMLLAYHEHAGLPMAPVRPRLSAQKWVAEDTLAMSILEMLWARDQAWRSLLRLARGERIFAIWSRRDPLPALAYLVTHFIPRLIGRIMRVLRAALKKNSPAQLVFRKGAGYESTLDDGKSRS